MSKIPRPYYLSPDTPENLEDWELYKMCKKDQWLPYYDILPRSIRMRQKRLEKLIKVGRVEKKTVGSETLYFAKAYANLQNDT